ncbi:MAG: SnoaL-like domain [Solirubrobacteraceae bacterium]|jgi:ketosteroid isomerase-like protein|nr:SnoaL-like domain [Solirubrobacteraceae bacterium]
MAEQRAKADPGTRNVEIVRATYEAANRGDVDAWLAPLDADVEVWDYMNGVIATDRGAYRRWIDHYLEAWEYYREIPEHIVPAGDRVVALVKSEARGAMSQAVIQECHGEVHTLAEGRIVKVMLYPTYGQALEAAGLDESAIATESVEASRPADTRGGGRFRAPR